MTLFCCIEELKKEKDNAEIAREEVVKLKKELQKIVAESDGFQAAAVFSESSQQEELQAIHHKYQEEIASLQHIMRGVVITGLTPWNGGDWGHTI